MISDIRALGALTVAAYTTDAEGRITFYNEAAAQFWGHRPEIGTKWCGSWRLFWPDGRPMRHEECPMAVALKEGRPVLGREAIAERPDGTRVPFVPYPSPLKDEAGRVVGGVNLLMDISARREWEIDAARLVAIVSSSDDAIISKTLNGVVTSWNAAATRIFGYQPEEMIGVSIKWIIPAELQKEEDEILAKLKRGERIEHFDTVRSAKDGRRIPISLTVSPVRNSAGVIVGASKISRDISERKQAEETQRLLFEELNHRVKNTLASIQAIANQSMRRATNPRDFVTSFNGRVQALARAHDLLVQGKLEGATLGELIRDQVVFGPTDGTRVFCSGPDVKLDPRVTVQLALVLHELATNARKYGALAIPTGHLSIRWTIDIMSGRELLLTWQESGVANVKAPRLLGFGSALIERSIEANGGEALVHYGAEGITWEIKLPLAEARFERMADHAGDSGHPKTLSRGQTGVANLSGKRILLVEDEPLVAMEMESELTSQGLEVIGPATNLESAIQMIAGHTFEAALVDANLGGKSVEEVAAALAQKGVPFAFATGYGREALPTAFRNAALLSKPFDPDSLISVVSKLLSEPDVPSNVLTMHPKSR